EGLRRIQNINTTKISTMQDLADVIMMLSMKPAKVATLRIIHYEPGESNSPEWYKSENNPEYAKELLTWIQDAIATRKLRNPVYSISRKCSTGQHLEFLSRVAMRHKIDRFDSEKYYAEGDTSDFDLDSDSTLNLKP
ncbi:15792_t:CDS:2, partial [Dentiscutata erythropus]